MWETEIVNFTQSHAAALLSDSPNPQLKDCPELLPRSFCTSIKVYVYFLL